jgi:acetyltransferase-like isoleucine patch superfamily enzyme
MGFQKNDDFDSIGNKHLRYDYIFDGVFMGKYTTMGGAYANCLGNKSRHDCIASVGRYTAINGTAYMNRDHAQGLTTNHRILYDIFNGKPGCPTRLRDYLVPANKIVIGNDVMIGAQTFINASKVKSVGNGALIGVSLYSQAVILAG